MSAPEREPEDPRPPAPVPWSRIAGSAARIAVVVVVTSIALGVVAFVAASSYAQYGAVRNAPNAEGWAGLSPRFAGQAACTACHAPEADAQDASLHVDVSCEDCHGPAAVHAMSESMARATVLGKPASGICATCHVATSGRPATFAQIDPTTHYSGGECLRCHAPHSVAAVRPPIVSHPLANLPACTVCHAPDGLKKVPSGHEVVGDTVCLSCHGASASGRFGR